MLINVKLEGGAANETCMGVTPNCWVVNYGNKPNIESYYRTDRRDAKGRVIFEYRSEVPSDAELEAIIQLGKASIQLT